MSGPRLKTVNIGEEVLYTRCSSGIVLLNLKSGEFYQLDPVGARMWTLLLEFGEISDVARLLAKEYDSDESSIYSDIETMVIELYGSGLLQKA